jgi:hypothetical protein
MLSSQTVLRAVLLVDVIISASLYFARFACCSTLPLEIVDMRLRTSLFDVYLMHLFRVAILAVVYSDLDGFAIQLAAPATARHYVLRNTLTLAAPFVCAVWVVIRFLLIGSAFDDASVPSLQTTPESRSLTFAFLALQLLFCVFEAAFRRLVTSMRKRWLYADLDHDEPVQRSATAAAAAAPPVGQLAFNHPPSSSEESDVERNNTNGDNLDFLLSKLDALIRKQPLDQPATQRLANSIQLESRAAAANLRADDAAKLLAAARALVDATLTLESAASLSSHVAQLRTLKPSSGSVATSEDDGAYLQRRRRDNYDAVGGAAEEDAEDDDDDDDNGNKRESEEVNLLA